MKKEFRICPNFMKDRNLYGFDWLEHVTAIPSPLVLVTCYKGNGKTNAIMQSWLSFSNDNGFYCIFSSVNKYSHMYSAVKANKQLVINFPDASIYKKCLSTVDHNRYDDDEIQLADLTVKKASVVNAPMVEECFLNLECEYRWEKELYPGSNHVVMCVKVCNVWMDENHYQENLQGRYGETGYLYNIHSPLNPESGEEEETCLGIIKNFRSYKEL
ncbi:flavin reductase family protein [Anaerosporobacter faecicola]|uniref:flavin reductase family protein n=1 Tax=Anaerosporobacter faecicola TaxID=2718714 RepID=UPI001EE60EB0|nr:flavin reductase [Anaerosporobacter faecicola]